MSITPENGVPTPLDLIKESDLEYSALFTITDETPSGTAFAVFSARDVVGNRGTEIDAGATLKIDTDGPAVKEIIVEPAGLIENDINNPLAINVTIGLTEAIKSGEVPTFSYLLSGVGRQSIAINSLAEITPLAGHAQTWQATFTLPGDAGLEEAETFRFEYNGSDDLDSIIDVQID